MRDYATVSPRFWTGQSGRAIRALGALEQLVALYLITGPTANGIGLYYLPIALVANDIGSPFGAPSKPLQSPFEGVKRALQRVVETGFAMYDEESQHVFVVEMARYQYGATVSRKDNRWKRICKDLEEVAKCPLVQHFRDRYAACFSLPDEAVTTSLQAVSRVDVKPLRSPFEAPSKPLRSQDQDQDQDQDQSVSAPSADRSINRRNTPEPALGDVRADCGPELLDVQRQIDWFDVSSLSPEQLREFGRFAKSLGVAAVFDALTTGRSSCDKSMPRSWLKYALEVLASREVKEIQQRQRAKAAKKPQLARVDR